MSSLWESALERLAPKLNSSTFETWIRPIECREITGDRIVLGAPDQFSCDWFREHYLGLVLGALREVDERDYEVVFEIVPQRAGEPVPHPISTSSDLSLPVVIAAAASSSSGSPGSSSQSRAIAHGTGPQAALESVADGVPPLIMSGDPDASPSSGPVTRSELNPKYTFDSFVVGPSNQLAHAASRVCADMPAGKYNPLFIYGGVGLGKTHLLHAIGAEIHRKNPTWRISYLWGERFMNEYIHCLRTNRMDEFRARYRERCDVLLMDDIQFIAGKDRTQDEFFHTFNALYESHRQIVLTSDKYPHEIPDLEERLRSRFQWGLIADIQPPELETRVSILKKKADAENLVLADDVALFLATTIKSHVRDLESSLVRLAAVASLSGTPITVEFARKAIEGSHARAGDNLSIDAIQKHVAQYFEVKVSDLKGEKRHRAIARPRQIAMYLCRTLLPHSQASFPEIGRRFGDKDHSTVISACRKIEQLMETDPETKGQVTTLKSQLLR